MVDDYQGTKLRVVLTKEASESYQHAIAGANKACVAQLLRYIKWLGDIGKLRSRDQFNSEGDGIFAIKANCGLRAYGWYSDRYPQTFVIGHVILKKKQKLDLVDFNRVKRVRQQYEME